MPKRRRRIDDEPLTSEDRVVVRKLIRYHRKLSIFLTKFIIPVITVAIAAAVEAYIRVINT